MSKRKYLFESFTINENGQAVDSNCIDITFINYGTVDLIINDCIIVPSPSVVGQFNAIELGGNEDEMDVTKYKVKFGIKGGAGTRQAIFIRRVYTND